MDERNRHGFGYAGSFCVPSAGDAGGGGSERLGELIYITTELWRAGRGKGEGFSYRNRQKKRQMYPTS